MVRAQAGVPFLANVPTEGQDEHQTDMADRPVAAEPRVGFEPRPHDLVRRSPPPSSASRPKPYHEL